MLSLPEAEGVWPPRADQSTPRSGIRWYKFWEEVKKQSKGLKRGGAKGLKSGGADKLSALLTSPQHLPRCREVLCLW